MLHKIKYIASNNKKHVKESEYIWEYTVYSIFNINSTNLLNCPVKVY